MNFFQHAGKKAIGSRLRLLSETITADAAEIYRLYDIDLSPKWFPVFYVLAELGPQSVTEIAKQVGYSHVAVSKLVREMAGAGYVNETSDAQDGRRNVVTLAAKGLEASEKIKDQYTDVQRAVEEISNQATHDLWQAMGEWEYLLNQQSLLRRVIDEKRKRESSAITIIDFTPAYASVFRDLNEAWISRYFHMEPADYKALDNPQTYIIDGGGTILVALHNDFAVGTCALINMHDNKSFELAKMAVSTEMHGKGIGLLLGKAAIEKAKEMGAARLYLESNTVLKPAISLYEKLGFRKVAGVPSPYERSNIQMELWLV
ncbi:bifunctional helix-turn-helix transcriptional regulator/GNAT family N-acetyltransferase [Chryseolinea sp. T2]|uniref:bifunctional helix-turn-helix transcriptional regulator/GNAT family N-acetyltransferase n=1 Tax=Chryseolinea sp. T2 TaxID=3129255 RepID=UPI003076E97A